MKKIWSVVLALALLLSMQGMNTVTGSAATKEMKLNVNNKITLTKGKQKKLQVNHLPKKAKVIWTTSNKKVVKVSKKGKITAVKKGTAKIKAKVTYRTDNKNRTKTFTVKVTVKNPAKKVSATPTAAITPTEAPGDVITPTEVPDAAITPIVMPTLAPEQSNLGEEHISANGVTTRDNGLMRDDLKAVDLMKYMGQGINIGNTLEATLAAADITENTTVSDYERAWGNPLIKQELLDGMKKYGFNTVRVPVAWSNMISDDGTYAIDETYLDRVEEVINYALNDEMYVIINIHWDGDWWGQFGDKDETVREQAWKRYEAFWTQIANRYQEYSDRLIFESANEELGDRLNDDWRNMSTYPKTGTLTSAELYRMTNEINQKFVDIVRGSGGNNTKRQLLIAGYDTDIVKTCDERYQMPEDIPENGTDKLSVSVHYYTPSTYCIVTQDEGWGYKDSWGTDEDKQELHGYFDRMAKFTEAGYGVIIGEYGAAGVNKDGIPDFLGEVARYGAQCGFCPVLWDIGTLFDRTDCKLKYIDVAQVYKDITNADVIIPESGETTGIKTYETISESELELKYTWNGIWEKNDGSNQDISFATSSCDDGLEIFCNSWKYYIYINADWESMQQPCVKAYLEDMSSANTLEIAYIDYVNGVVDSGDRHNGELQIPSGWQGKCVVLDKEKLADNDALYLTFGGKVTCTKIEIYDLAD